MIYFSLPEYLQKAVSHRVNLFPKTVNFKIIQLLFLHISSQFFPEPHKNLTEKYAPPQMGEFFSDKFIVFYVIFKNLNNIMGFMHR